MVAAACIHALVGINGFSAAQVAKHAQQMTQVDIWARELDQRQVPCAVVIASAASDIPSALC